MIKKADIILFFVLLIAGLAAAWFSLMGNAYGSRVIVTVDGEHFGTYDLSIDYVVEVKQEDGHTNHITIKDGTVSMSYSDCANQVCVNTGAISETKDSIVCLPNKVMIEVETEGQGGGADVISH